MCLCARQPTATTINWQHKQQQLRQSLTMSLRQKRKRKIEKVFAFNFLHLIFLSFLLAFYLNFSSFGFFFYFFASLPFIITFLTCCTFYSAYTHIHTHTHVLKLYHTCVCVCVLCCVVYVVFSSAIARMQRMCYKASQRMSFTVSYRQPSKQAYTQAHGRVCCVQR